MTMDSGQSNNSLADAFDFLCARRTADQLAELTGVDREVILRWSRTQLPDKLAPHVEDAIFRGAGDFR